MKILFFFFFVFVVLLLEAGEFKIAAKGLFTKVLLFLFLSFAALLLEAGEFRIVATADLHGNLRNLAALAPALRAAGADIKIDAGDLIGGNPIADCDGGRSMIEALNLLHFDFRVPGNHDFETAPGDFHELLRRFRGTTLGSDWSWNNVSGVPFRIVTKGKFRCGVIGLTEPDIRRRHLPDPGSPRFRPWEKCLEQSLAELRRRKVHAVVLVWHNGIEARPNGIAGVIRRFPEIDLVIAAHSHRENPGLRLGGAYVVQPGPFGTSAALARILYDDGSCKVRNIESALLRGDREHPAPDLLKLSREAAAPWRKFMNRKICCKGDLNRKNFSALAVRALARAGDTPGAVFICSYGREETGEGSSYRDLCRLIPFRNTLCTVELDRKELEELMTDLFRSAPRFKRRIAVHGFTCRGAHNGKGVPDVRAPERLRLTVSDYLMVSAPVLRRITARQPGRWRRLDIVERDAVADFLSRRLEEIRHNSSSRVD